MATQGTQAPLNEAKLNEFMNKAIGDMGAAMSASLIAIGEQLMRAKPDRARRGSGAAGELEEVGGGELRISDRGLRIDPQRLGIALDQRTRAARFQCGCEFPAFDMLPERERNQRAPKQREQKRGPPRAIANLDRICEKIPSRRRGRRV